MQHVSASTGTGTHLRSCDELKRLFSQATSQKPSVAAGSSRESRSTRAPHTECTRGWAAVEESNAGRSVSTCCLVNIAPERAPESREQRAVAEGESRSASFTASNRASASAACLHMQREHRPAHASSRSYAPLLGGTATRRRRRRLTAPRRACLQVRHPAAPAARQRLPHEGSLSSEQAVSFRQRGAA